MKGQSQMSAPRLTEESPKQNLSPPLASFPLPSSAQCDSLGVIARESALCPAQLGGQGCRRPVATLTLGWGAGQGKAAEGVFEEAPAHW